MMVQTQRGISLSNEKEPNTCGPGHITIHQAGRQFGE